MGTSPESLRSRRSICLVGGFHSWGWVGGFAEHPANGVVSRITHPFDPDGEGTVLTFTQEGLADQTDADHHEMVGGRRWLTQ